MAAAIISLIVAVLVYALLQAQVRQAGPPPVREVTVVVAATDIPRYTVIGPHMLTQIQMDAIAAPAGYIGTPADAVNKIARVAFRQGEPLTRGALEARTAEAGLTFVIPDGMRAVTVALDPISGVGGFVLPGDRVDVLASFQLNDVAVTRTILQNVEVLAIGEETRRPTAQAAVTDQPGAQPGAQTGEAPAAEQVKNATLAVDPHEAQALILAAYKGAVHLVLRPPEEVSTVSLQGRTDWELMGLPGPPAEKPTREAPEPAPQMPVTSVGYMPLQAPSQIPGQPPVLSPAQAQAQQAAPARAEPGATVEVIRGTQRELVSTQ